mmetsp:Transcript_123845/g.284030  ORF Transcript_123845/g.284030 Transcript_123845/m.284030 type:complete len:369 (-) Transcript_123845:434-1540(-)
MHPTPHVSHEDKGLDRRQRGNLNPELHLCYRLKPDTHRPPLELQLWPGRHSQECAPDRQRADRGLVQLCSGDTQHLRDLDLDSACSPCIHACHSEREKPSTSCQVLGRDESSTYHKLRNLHARELHPLHSHDAFILFKSVRAQGCVPVLATVDTQLVGSCLRSEWSSPCLDGWRGDQSILIVTVSSTLDLVVSTALFRLRDHQGRHLRPHLSFADLHSVVDRHHVRCAPQRDNSARHWACYLVRRRRLLLLLPVPRRNSVNHGQLHHTRRLRLAQQHTALLTAARVHVSAPQHTRATHHMHVHRTTAPEAPQSAGPLGALVLHGHANSTGHAKRGGQPTGAGGEGQLGLRVPVQAEAELRAGNGAVHQ